jgi:hypothetical protein
MPVILYTDNCCKDREFIRALLDELKRVDPFFDIQTVEGQSPQTANPYEPLDFPANKTPVHVPIGDASLDLVCYMIRKRDSDAPQIVGLDIEYNPGFIPAADGPNVAPATLQLSFDNGDSWVFSLFENGKKKANIPSPLLTVLKDKRFTFVG